jgi:hypothetical protein
MRVSLSSRKIGAIAVALGAATTVFMSVGSASAATVPARESTPAAQVVVRHIDNGVAAKVTLTKGSDRPNTALSCVIYDPDVTVTYSNGEISWSGSTACNVVLHMYGTTVLYRWGSSSAYAFGSQINGYYSYATSSGAVYGIYGGSWGVNNNMDIYIPAGYTATLGGGCHWVVVNSEFECTATTGPFNGAP